MDRQWIAWKHILLLLPRTEIFSATLIALVWCADSNIDNIQRKFFDPTNQPRKGIFFFYFRGRSRVHEVLYRFSLLLDTNSYAHATELHFNPLGASVQSARIDTMTKFEDFRISI